MFSLPEFESLLHGLVLGGGFILGVFGYLVALLDLASVDPESASGRRRLTILRGSGWLLAGLGWAVVVLGTYVVVPWYRLTPPEGATDLSRFPRAFLRADPDLAFWHVYGMEWKEYLGWIPPIAMTAAAFLVTRSGARLPRDPILRRALLALVAFVFVTASLTGVLGALITKVAPVR